MTKTPNTSSQSSQEPATQAALPATVPLREVSDSLLSSLATTVLVDLGSDVSMVSTSEVTGSIPTTELTPSPDVLRSQGSNLSASSQGRGGRNE